MKLTNETAALDHIIPISKGGHPTDARNGQFVHEVVNKMKGTLELEELLFWVQKIGSTISEWGLSPTAPETVADLACDECGNDSIEDDCGKVLIGANSIGVYTGEKILCVSCRQKANGKWKWA